MGDNKLLPALVSRSASDRIRDISSEDGVTDLGVEAKDGISPGKRVKRKVVPRCKTGGGDTGDLDISGSAALCSSTQMR